MPTISVIVPVYKVEPYLRQCVDSILSQSFRDFELILVDDGSPDGCPAICDEYAIMDSRVSVIHKENGGLSSARNAGLDVATGNYISFIDSDDMVHADFLTELLKAIQQHNADLALCGVQKFCDSGVSAEKNLLTAQNLCREEVLSLIIHSQWYHVVAWNKLYRKAIFDNIRFPEGYIHEDEAVFHRILDCCGLVTVISRDLYFYRQSSNSIMRQDFKIQRTDKLTAIADRVKFAYVNHWTEVYTVTSSKYVEMFFDYYFRFPRTAENEKYFLRMEDSLKTALPYILKSKTVSLRHKIYLSIIRFNPRLYTTLRRFKG